MMLLLPLPDLHSTHAFLGFLFGVDDLAVGRNSFNPSRRKLALGHLQAPNIDLPASPSGGEFRKLSPEVPPSVEVIKNRPRHLRGIRRHLNSGISDRTNPSGASDLETTIGLVAAPRHFIGTAAHDFTVSSESEIVSTTPRYARPALSNTNKPPGARGQRNLGGSRRVVGHRRISRGRGIRSHLGIPMSLSETYFIAKRAFPFDHGRNKTAIETDGPTLEIALPCTLDLACLIGLLSVPHLGHTHSMISMGLIGGGCFPSVSTSEISKRPRQNDALMSD